MKKCRIRKPSGTNTLYLPSQKRQYCNFAGVRRFLDKARLCGLRGQASQPHLQHCCFPLTLHLAHGPAAPPLLTPCPSTTRPARAGSANPAQNKMGLLRGGLASIKLFRDASRRETLLQCPPAPSPQPVSERSVNTYLVVLNDKDCNTKQFNPININDSVPGDTRVSEMCS